MPSRRSWSPTALPSAWVKIASSTSRPYVSDVRCCALPSCRMWLATVLPICGSESASTPSKPSSRAARRRQAIAQDAVTDRTAISECGIASSTPYARCSAMPSCRMGACSTRNVTSRANDAEPCHRAGRGCTPGCRQRVRKSQLHQQALQLLPAMRCHCHRVGRCPLQCGHKAGSISKPYASYVRCGATPLRRMRTPTARPPVCAKGQQHQHAPHLLRALQCRAMVPDVITYGAATGWCNKCRQHQQALHPLRAMRR